MFTCDQLSPEFERFGRITKLIIPTGKFMWEVHVRQQPIVFTTHELAGGPGNPDFVAKVMEFANWLVPPADAAEWCELVNALNSAALTRIVPEDDMTE